MIDGKLVEKEQKITDQKVIRAYLRSRKKTKPDDKKSSLRCSSCGQVGHMKTNKNCPNYIGAKKVTKERKKASLILQEKLGKLLSQFSAIPFSSPFHRPVSEKKFPTYKTIVKEPMDFQRIRNNIRNGVYTSYGQFLGDMILIRENCKLFNGSTHSLSEIARDFVERTESYKVENYAELLELEQRIEKGE